MIEVEPFADAAVSEEQALLAYLRGRDVHCPLCKYNLRDLATPRCPECGRELRLTVGLVEQRQAAYLTAQIALAAAGGIGVMIVLMAIVAGWPSGNHSQWLLNIAFSNHIVMVPVAALLLVYRRRFLRLSPAVQWALAALAVLVEIAGMAGLTITLM